VGRRAARPQSTALPALLHERAAPLPLLLAEPAAAPPAAAAAAEAAAEAPASAAAEQPDQSSSSSGSSRGGATKAPRTPSVLGSSKQLAAMLQYNTHFQTGGRLWPLRATCAAACACTAACQAGLSRSGAGPVQHPCPRPCAAAGDEYSSQTVQAIDKRARNALQHALAKRRLELAKQGGLSGAIPPANTLQEAMQQQMGRLQQQHGL
jgi:hypothetical protein